VLSLALGETEIEEECITNQGIRLNVRAVAAFKVGDDEISIANAARRFLSEQNRMEVLVGRIFAGHLRSIVGGLTVEQIIKERDRVAQEVKEGSHSEMEKLGIVVDALEIQEIDDAIGYINNLAAPHAAAVASLARTAKARADQEAAEREIESYGLKAQYERDLAIRRAGTVRQAELAAQRLEAEVRRPADAEAYRTRTLAEAKRDETRFAAEAEAYQIRAAAGAQADANKVRAASLREGNQERAWPSSTRSSTLPRSPGLSPATAPRRRTSQRVL